MIELSKRDEELVDEEELFFEKLRLELVKVLGHHLRM